MKKNIINFTVLLTLTLVFLVLGCKKEETILTLNQTHGQNVDYNIEELIKKTGIDIYALAASSELLNYFEKLAPISEKIAESLNNMSSAKSLTIDEKIARMEELMVLISIASQDYDFDLVDEYFNEFESLYITLPSFEVISQNNYEHILEEEVQILLNFLTTEYPSFFTLDKVQQGIVVDAIVEIFNGREPGVGGDNKCEKDRADSIRKAEIQYGITVAGCCLITGPAAWACAGVALGVYCTEHHFANKAYKKCKSAS